MNKHSPIKDLRTLQYVYTLPEALKIREYIDMIEASETAMYKDLERQRQTDKGKR